MYKNKKIIAIIPARGGSKRVPRKNIRILAGKPLIAYTIEGAKNSKYISRILVSTEDKKISQISRKMGAEVIARPKKLTKDTTPTIDVILHALNFLKGKEGYVPELVVLLQPTSPFRTSEDIDKSIELFMNTSNCLSLISVTEFENPPFWALKVEKNSLKPVFGKKYFRMRHQDLLKTYRPNGAIFIAKPETLYKYKTFYTSKSIAYFMPVERSVDIDTEFDFLFAKFLITHKRKTVKLRL